jgi:hypothetical protein
MVLRATGLDRAERLHAVLQISTTFSLICVSWIFFRAASVTSALTILQTIWLDAPRMLSPAFLKASFTGLQFQVPDILIPCLGTTGLLAFDFVAEHSEARRPFSSWPVQLRWATYYVGVLVLLYAGKFGEQQFIYFQF